MHSFCYKIYLILIGREHYISLNLSVYKLHNFYGLQNMVFGVWPVNGVNLIKRSNDFASSVTGASE